MKKSSFIYANHTLESCSSTMDLARQCAHHGYPHGTWVSARFQTTGRGRLGRSWDTCAGNLFLSILVQIKQTTLRTWIPLVTALSIIQWLNEKFPHLLLNIKWPNDIYLENSKLGGILCEGVRTQEGKSFIIIGIGINCVDSPQGLNQKVTHLTQHLHPQKITASDLRLPILSAVLNSIQVLENTGYQSFIELYQIYALMKLGTPIQWDIPPKFGRIQGLGAFGELQILSNDNHIKRLFNNEQLSYPNICFL